jgi:glutamate formiminotransferase/glutamate formiminotransferase/formiminotetrahydrofolate cyclodeaminase
MAVPNVSEGRDLKVVGAIGEALSGPDTRLLDIHTDPDHHRSVFTLAGSPGALAPALLSGAAIVVQRIDLNSPRGDHPHVGALDVVPIVYVQQASRGAACAEALLAADLLAETLRLPVFLYGALGGGRSRAELRRGGLAMLAERMRTGELDPDFGPDKPHPTAGAVLVAARAPLVAFNLELAPPATLRTASSIAAVIREGGAEGVPGLRAIGVELAARGGSAQVSMNVEDPLSVPLARVVDAVRRHAAVDCAELVGLAPRAALEGFPQDVPIRGFDPARHVIEQALGC